MAVAVGILVQVVLVVLLGSVEVLQGQALYGDGLREKGLLFGEYLINSGQLVVCDVVDACAIACALVVALLVEACGVDGLEEHL